MKESTLTLLELFECSSEVDIMDLALLLTLLLPVAVVSHVLDLPSKVLFKVGDRRELTCSMSSCPEKVKFVWTTIEDRPLFTTTDSRDRESVMVFDSVMKNHENTILCKATCGKETKHAPTTVTVYSFPKNPVISGYDSLKLGEESVLRCEVSSVHPLELLEVQWLYGDTVLHTYEGESEGYAYSFPFIFTPSNEDDGKAITCRASLPVDGIPADEMTKETSVPMTVLSAPHNVKVSGVTAVLLGSSLTLTCEAEGKPKPAFTWTALKPDGQSVEMGKHQDLFMQDVSLSDAGTYQCDVSNDLGSQRASVSVVVQAPPMDTLIVASPQSTLKEGDSVSISCNSSGVPVTHVVLSRRVNGVKTEIMSREGAETSVTIDSVKLADSGMFVCEAFNDYGSQETTLNLTVEAHLLEVALQPDDEVVLEKGSSLILSCQASGCPQPKFSWKNLSNMPILSRLKRDGFRSQLVVDLVELEDEGTYLCEVTCGSIKKSKQTEVKVFSFPTSPVVKNYGPSLVGEMMKLTCTAQEVFPANLFQILWMDGEREVHLETGSFSSGTINLTSVYSYRVNTEDQDKRITCKVLLEMRGVPAAQAVKTASTTLSVYYPPRATSITVSPLTELKEGESVSISCLSDSFPVGRTVLSRVMNGGQTELMTSDGLETLFTIPLVELDDSGVYVCETSNMYGSHNDSVEITVKAPPRNTTVEIFPSTDVQEGQNITICCRSLSFPPPTVVLSKLDSEKNVYSLDGVFLMINLTPNDTGLYQINVTNHLGYETEIFNISVMEKRVNPPLGWNDFLIPAICLGVAAALLGVVVYVWRARKKGSYDLTKCNLSTV
ncbi:vascular cell adhesion protein 1-like [Sinocyclocheilus grahami]|uniref:Vascular cell adhesion protein 1-like n=1 Tax=Sinocyclocheilus grahami TaxID=75366 RepID=A0A672JW00_SINGR|nr:PREDICTED: vascular cell adhesion protein 1-like [Sinocyclocheilus grahami]